MKKEKLMKTKKETAKMNLDYTCLTSILDTEILKNFSISQIKIVCELMKSAQSVTESRNPFVVLSATEVLQKSSGKIAEFTESGEIKEEYEKEILQGAAREIYKNWKNRKRA